ncbi:MAG: hypothetical protein C0596_00310 [Marinilabiliales bacterium]|nr:MAG: hypothetical protein C0596_00310 [Marinilabiliales bacterium]
MKIIFLILFTIIILTSCNTDDNRCFKSNGEIKTVETPINYFNKIIIESDLEIYIENSSESSITIIAGENLIPYIEYSVVNNTLIIEDNNGCDFLRKDIKPIIILKTPVIEEITINQACDLKTTANDTLKFDNLSIQTWAGIFTSDLNIYCDSLFFRCHATTGDYTLKGDCNYAYIYNIGSGYLKASHLECDFIQIVHRSLCKSHINATQQIILEDIQHGSVTAYSEECPQIITWGNDFGNLFENIGCPD